MRVEHTSEVKVFKTYADLFLIFIESKPWPRVGLRLDITATNDLAECIQRGTTRYIGNHLRTRNEALKQWLAENNQDGEWVTVEVQTISTLKTE